MHMIILQICTAVTQMKGAQIRGIVRRLQGWGRTGCGFLERKNILIKYDVSRNIDTTRIGVKTLIPFM